MEIIDSNPDRFIVDVDKLSIKGTSAYQTRGGLWVLGCIAITGAQFGVCSCGGVSSEMVGVEADTGHPSTCKCRRESKVMIKYCKLQITSYVSKCGTFSFCQFQIMVIQYGTNLCPVMLFTLP